METPADRPGPGSGRVVITGLGVVSRLGIGPETLWARLNRPEPAEMLCCGSSGLAAVCPAEFAGHVDEFGELPPAMRKQLAKSLKVMNRETQMGVAAGYQALRASGVLGAVTPERIGVCFGAGNVSLAPDDFRSAVHRCEDESGELNLSRWGTDGIDEVAPLWLLRCLPNMPACHLAILADLRGPSNTVTQPALGADLALAEACRTIRSGNADAMLVGGSGTCLPEMSRLRAHWEHEAIRGEDPEQYGSQELLSEGAGAVVLEDLNSAVARGATMFGEVLAVTSASGFGRSSGLGNSRSHSAMTRAIRLALQQAGLSARELGHLHLPDAVLPRISQDGLPDCAPMLSVRGQLGHAGAGSAAMELVASLLALQHGVLPGGANAVSEGRSSPVHPHHTNATSAASGTCFLKVSRNGRKQTSCVVISGVMDKPTPGALAINAGMSSPHTESLAG